MTGPWIAERQVVFVDRGGRRAAGRIAVGRPARLDANEALCRCALDGLDPAPRWLHGAEPMQALVLAMQFVGTRLHEFASNGGRVLEPDGKTDACIEAIFGPLFGASAPGAPA